jgi:hypothetical protein
MLQRTQDDPDPVIAETAKWASQRINKSEETNAKPRPHPRHRTLTE